MNQSDDSTPPVRSRFAWAVTGLILAIISPVFWLLLLNNNFMQRTALPMWVAMAIGLLVAVFSARADRRQRTLVTAALTGGWIVFSIIGYTIFTRIPGPRNITSITAVADLPLANHLGESVRLTDVLRDGSALMIFYRGHW